MCFRSYLSKEISSLRIPLQKKGKLYFYFLMTRMFPELFLSLSAMYLLFLPKKEVRSSSHRRRVFLGVRTFLSLIDLRNRACISSLLRTRMRRASAWILLLRGNQAHQERKAQSTFPFLIVCRTRAAMFMLRTDSLLSIYLRLELQRLCRYVMTRRENQRAVEARLKYLILGAFRSGLLLFGMALIYRSQATLTTWPRLSHGPEESTLLRGLTFLRRGLFFKAGRRPFHFWVPDVYARSPTLTRTYFRTVRKRGILGVLMSLPLPTRMLWRVRCISMLLGVLGAIPQTHLKRLFRYSSIAQVGFMRLGLLGSSALGKTRVVRYILVYLRTGLHAFSIFLSPTSSGSITTFRDLKESMHGGLKLQVRITFFSLAGLPPLLGFFAKASVLQYAAELGEFRRVRIALLASIIGRYYSLKVIQRMYMDYQSIPCRSRRASKELGPILSSLLCTPSVLLLGRIRLR